MEQKIGDIKDSKAVGNNTCGDNNTSTIDKKHINIGKYKVRIDEKSYLSVCSIFLSIGALMVSVIAIWICAPRYEELGFDYTGVIVTVLSLLVTILIAWQIYITLTLDNRVKQYISDRIRSTKGDIYQDMDTKIKDYDYHLGSILLHTKANNSTDKKNAIKYYFLSLHFANKSSYKDNLNHLIDDLKISMAAFAPSRDCFTKKDIDNFNQILSDCENFKSIELVSILDDWEKIINPS